MRTLDDAVDQFAYHPATPDTAPRHTAPRHAALRDATIDFTRQTWDLIPDGPERTLALRSLQQFLMYAQLAVALTAPADLGETRAMARELPHPSG